MSWGISDNAPEIEKIFCDFADAIAGMNSCCEIDYKSYSAIWDLGRTLCDKAYEQGKKDRFIEEIKNAHA